jgi:hypothetical protein
LSRSKGKVSKGLHGFQCPSAIVEQIQSRQFTLPYEHPVSTINQPLTTAHITTMARVSKSAQMEACCMKENGYEGEWKDDLFYGYGTYNYENGDVYTGE